jgi:hypothetical protein
MQHFVFIVASLVLAKQQLRVIQILPSPKIDKETGIELVNVLKCMKNLDVIYQMFRHG